MKRVLCVLFLAMLAVGAWAGDFSGTVTSDADVAVETGVIIEIATVDLVYAASDLLCFKLESISTLTYDNELDEAFEIAQTLQLIVTLTPFEGLSIAIDYLTSDLAAESVGYGNFGVVVTWSF